MKIRCRLIACAVLLVATILLLNGCGNQGDRQTAETFLGTLYTSNQDGRWDALQQNPTGEAEYYLPLSALCTKSCLVQLQANRCPITYDRLTAEAGLQLIPVQVTVKSTSDTGRFSFEVELQDTEQAKSFVQSGELTVIRTEAAYLVDSFWSGSLSQLAEALNS